MAEDFPQPPARRLIQGVDYEVGEIKPLGPAPEAPSAQPEAGVPAQSSPIEMPGPAVPAVPEHAPAQPDRLARMKRAAAVAGEVLGHAERIARKANETGVTDWALKTGAKVGGKTGTAMSLAARGAQTLDRVGTARRSVAAAFGPETTDGSPKPFVPSPANAKGFANDPSSPSLLPPINRNEGSVHVSAVESDPRWEVMGTHMGSNESAGEFHLDIDPWLGLEPGHFNRMMRTREGREALLRRRGDLADEMHDRLRFERGASVEADEHGNVSDPMVNPHGITLAPRFGRVKPDSTMFEPRIYGDPRAGSRSDLRAQRLPWVPEAIDRRRPDPDMVVDDPLTIVEKAKHSTGHLLRRRRAERRNDSALDANLDALESGGLTQAEVAESQRELAEDNRTYREKGGYAHVGTNSQASRAPITEGEPDPPRRKKGQKVPNRQKLKPR